jgi:hypothetical protein
MIFKLCLPSVEKNTQQRALFAECYIFDTRQRSSLPSVKKALGKEVLCRVSKIKHSAKIFPTECFLLPRVFCVALGKKFICRVPEKNNRQNIWYSAKSQILVVDHIDTTVGEGP